MKHLLYYLSLAAILASGVVAVLFLQNQKTFQIAIVVLLALFYAVWGIVHHAIEHSFSIKIVLEYISIALLSISLVLFVLNIAL
jgi:uncharacterized membrane protein YjjP (DUF1212 family)